MTTRRTRVALALVVYLVLLSQVLLYPGIDALVERLGAPPGIDSSMWFLAAEFAAYVAFAGVWGLLSDRAGTRRPFLTASAVLGAAGYAALTVLPVTFGLPFAAVLGLRVLQGAASVGVLTLSLTALMDLSGGHGRNMGAAGIAIGLGTATGAPIGGQLYGVGVLVPLAATAGCLLVAAAVTLLVDEAPPDESRPGVRAVLDGIRRTPTLGLPYLFGFADRMVAGFFALVGTLYFRTVFGLDPGTTGLVLALFFAPFALLQYPFGVLSDRVGRTAPVVGGSAACGVAIVAVGLAPTVQLAAAGMALVGVVAALMAPATMALVTDLAAETDRGAAMGGFNIFGSLGFLAGVLVGGTVADWAGYTAAFWVVGGIEVVIAVLSIPLFLRLRPAINLRDSTVGGPADERS